MVSPIPIKVCASDILPKIRLCFEVPRPSKGRRQNAKSITRVLVEVSKWSRRFTLRTQIANNIDTRVPAAGVQLLVGMYYRYCCSTAKWNGLSAKPLGISRESISSNCPWIGMGTAHGPAHRAGGWSMCLLLDYPPSPTPKEQQQCCQSRYSGAGDQTGW